MPVGIQCFMVLHIHVYIYIHILQSDSASPRSMGGAHGVHIGLHKIWLLVTLSILMYTMAS